MKTGVFLKKYTKYILMTHETQHIFCPMKKVLVLLAFAVCGLLVGSAYYMYRQWNQPTLNTTSQLIEIPMGASSAQIGRILQKNGIIASGRAFHTWCRVHSMGPRLKAGWYEIPPGLTLSSLADLIASGKNASIKVTIPEGRATWEIFQILKKAIPRLDSATFDSLTHSAAHAKSLGVSAPSLEGYLLPETYAFPYGYTEADIISQLVRANLAIKAEFENATGSTWPILGNWHRVLTLASVVEEETGKTDERPHIAGVFHNRLRIGMPLGADPTVRFIFRNLTGPIYKSQLESASPYNTRRFTGLMPGPISNPGRKAIEAALWPLETPDLYFVAKDDGSGTHFFSTTLTQHNSYKGTAASNRGE